MNARRILTAVLAAAAVLTGSAAVTVTTAPTAQAATVLVKGPGVAVKLGSATTWLGAYRDPATGALVWCEDLLLQAGDGTFKAGPHPVRYTAETRARLATLINLYGPSATTNSAALRVKLAQNTLIAPHDPVLRKWMPTLMGKATAADKTAVTAMVARSAIHAPYRATVTLEGAVPGQRGKATVRVVGSNGKAASGLKVAWTLGGGKAVSTTTATNSLGQAYTVFDGTGLGQTVTATVTGPSATRVWSNVPSRGHQVMIGGGFTDTIKASDAAELCPITLTVSKSCDCSKTGRTASYTFTATDAFAGRYVAILKVNGTPTKSAALAAGQTVTLTVPVRNGDTVEASYTITDATGHALWTETLDTFTQGAGR